MFFSHFGQLLSCKPTDYASPDGSRVGAGTGRGVVIEEHPVIDFHVDGGGRRHLLCDQVEDLLVLDLEVLMGQVLTATLAVEMLTDRRGTRNLIRFIRCNWLNISQMVKRRADRLQWAIARRSSDGC